MRARSKFYQYVSSSVSHSVESSRARSRRRSRGGGYATMSFRGEESGSGGDEGRGDLRKPFLHTGSWYRMGMAGMGSRQSSLMTSSASVLRDSSISVVLCTLIVALGPVQFGFTGGYSSPTQDDIISDLGLSLSEVAYYFSLPSRFLILLRILSFARLM